MQEQFEFYLDSVREYIDVDVWEETNNSVDNMFFKINKAKYHFVNITNILDMHNLIKFNDTTDRDYDEIYYEMESFLVTIRSSVDLIMHMVNNALDLGIKKKDVTIGSIYHEATLPARFKNVLHQFSHNRDSETWNFIYSTRNEIVHSSSIKEMYPVTINNYDAHTVTASFEVKGKEKDMVTFFKAIINFVERFLLKILETLSYVLKNNK